jgi:hypothetical protein
MEPVKIRRKKKQQADQDGRHVHRDAADRARRVPQGGLAGDDPLREARQARGRAVDLTGPDQAMAPHDQALAGRTRAATGSVAAIEAASAAQQAGVHQRAALGPLGGWAWELSGLRPRWRYHRT